MWKISDRMMPSINIFKVARVEHPVGLFAKLYLVLHKDMRLMYQINMSTKRKQGGSCQTFTSLQMDTENPLQRLFAFHIALILKEKLWI